ncbi:MAG: SDR family oxidoreductase [Planctomycetota bacterium]
MPNRNILITGVSRGLGLALTESLVDLGHTLFGCARSEPAVRALSERFGSPHHFQAVDISDDRAVEDWADTVLANGTPDLILNNAAVINANNSVWDVPVEEFSNLIDINIKGSFHVIRSFVPAMIRQGNGVVVNFSSTWGRSTSPEVGPYCASKYAIEGLNSSLAQELPSGLAAVAFNPGVINTDMLQSCFGEGSSHYPSAQQWAVRAVPFLLGLSSVNNGDSTTVP